MVKITETNLTAVAMTDNEESYRQFMSEFTIFANTLLNIEQAHRVGEQGGLYWPVLKLLQSVANGGERQVVDAGTRRAKSAREIQEIFRQADAPGMEIPVARVQAKAEFIERLDFQECFARALRDAFAVAYEELTNETWTPYKPAPVTKQSQAEIAALKAWAMKALGGNDSPTVDPLPADEEEALTSFDNTSVGMERANGQEMEPRG